MRLVLAATAAALAWAGPWATAAAQAPQGSNAAPPPPPAVTVAPTAETVRQEARTDKRGLVERNMQLTAEEAKKFWPLYDDYQMKLDRIVQRQNRALLDYINAEATMTDANAKRIAREILAADADEQKLRERQFRKLLAALPARKAVRYMQIENKIRAIDRYAVAERMSLMR